MINVSEFAIVQLLQWLSQLLSVSMHWNILLPLGFYLMASSIILWILEFLLHMSQYLKIALALRQWGNVMSSGVLSEMPSAI